MKAIIKKMKGYIGANLARKRNRYLKNKDFTIISNNCWGGFVCQHVDLPYNSPFIGLFLFSPDYIKLLGDLRGYLSMNIQFITPRESKYSSELDPNSPFSNYPIGLLGDIEIHFLHYSSESEAKEKWDRRVNRINYDNLIIKFCDRDLATDKLIRDFFSLPYKNKIFLSAKNYDDKSCLKLKNEHGLFIENEWKNYKKTISPLKHLNSFF